MPGSKYKIEIGIAGVQQTVAGINKVRDAQTARAQAAEAERRFAKNLEAERRAAEEALPVKQRLKNLDNERARNTQRLAEATRKLQQREARGVASPFLRHRVAALKLANQEIDKQIRKVRQLQREGGMMGRLRGAMRGVGGRLAGSLGLFSLGAATRRTLSGMGQLQRQAGTIGVGTDFLQEFQFGAEQSGIKADQAAMGLQRFARRLAQAQQGSGELLPTLQQMGIELTDAAGNAKDTETVLHEFADAMAGIEDPQARLLAAFKAFDSEGAALVTVMKNGAEGLKAFAEQAHSSGAIFEREVVNRLAAADSQLVALGRVLKVDFANVLFEVLPFILNVRGALLLLMDASQIVAGTILSIARQLIRNPLGMNMQLLQMMGRRAADQLGDALDRRLAERDMLLRGVAPGVPGVPGGEGAAVAGGTATRRAADALQRIGGTRGGNGEVRRQLELLQRQHNLTQQQLRELQRIARNTDILQ